MSPEAWADSKPIIAAVAAAEGVAVIWPNEDSGERPHTPEGSPLPWLEVDFGAEASGPMELGGRLWNEDGAIFLHLFIPARTGIDSGLAVRKEFAVAFRSQEPIGPTVFRSAAFDPAADENGTYTRLTLTIRYSYQDVLML